MFLLVFIFVSSYLMLTERYKASLLVMMPVFLIYFMVAGLQYNVGTDYFSYIDIFQSEVKHWYYFNKGEYLFFGLNQFLNWLSLPAQSIFLVISFIQSFLIFLYFKKIKQLGLILWVFFIVFFTVTNIYNNQLNGLRQYVVITGIPLFTIFLHERKLLHSLGLLVVLSFFHNTAWLLIIFYPIFYVQNKFNINLLCLFIISAVGYFFAGGFIYDLTSLILPNYVHYLQSDLSEPRTISVFFTKLYYLPLVFYFYIIYRKDNANFGDYIHFMLFIFSITYWFFLLALSVGIATRLYYYFIFFYIFPIYYILHYNYVRNRSIEFLFILVYIVFPYFFKVTALAKAEFLYESFLWN